MIGLTTLWRDRRGAAAAEMALVAPLLAVIMFGSLELGKFFWDEHVVLKAVRDGARYASRQKFADMPCSGPPTGIETKIQNLVRYGTPTPTGSDKPRLHYWTSNSTVTVTINCYANAGVGGSRVYDGIYTTRAEVPVVEVSAKIPYDAIIGAIGVDTAGFELNAKSEATVFGI